MIMIFEVFCSDFFQNYFFSGYNIVNTLVYGCVVFISIYFIIKILRYFEINPFNLFIPLIPFIFIGSSTRALVEYGIYQSSWFLATPGISFIIGILASTTILLGLFIQKRTNFDFRYTVFSIGSILAIKNIGYINHLNLYPIIGALFVWGIISFILVFIGRYWDLLKNKFNLASVSAHILDASTTFLAVEFYGYNELHILPNSIFNLTNTAITIFPLKIIVILICLYLVDNYIEDEITAGTFKLAIFGLGLLIGLRNLLIMSI